MNYMVRSELKLKRIITFILLIPIFAYNFFATSWTGSYIMLEENWEKHIIFTPKNASEPKQIYEIDKFLYAFKYQPIITIVCIISFLILISIIVIWIIKKYNNNDKSIVN
ncbi:DUF4306 domain-containing protein [Metabacillus halosaccharovorans]|uniref:DUF4306 domain-containing protein n=1 Tax=Metabacillus halosaccharovorans TaxID=930124 RepID=UPI003D349864|nr:DUF4306 domain-containing protein [Metabacillus halosaccharovorans]